ncbi:metallophosphoesterase family protein [Novosphingobium sp.]|uniref:purple acid phosphatase family protein n=1 Tax=Novosphingobium sp. TaxID=1874826 RepID=UPI002733EDAF|nr:metallophosphoesterase family protein [Novosphingobium sp.]MDP3908556.1 metallophosphoesterase family protein [Novosphingobium sp.]
MLIATAVLALAVPIHAHEGGHKPDQAPWQQASGWPDRIVATVDGNPATSISVNWRTDTSVTATRAEIAKALPDARFDQLAATVAAQSETIDLAAIQRAGVRIPVAHNEGLPGAAYHSVRFEGLEPDTLYAYRVQGADGKWSEWFQTRTAPRQGPVKFIYLGDAQNGLDSHWPRVIRAAFQTAPDARFILHAGDLVNRGSRDLEWAQWFRAGGFIHGMVPAIPVAGNHEYEAIGLTEADKQRALAFLWRPQFRLPVEATLPAELHETVYDIRYSDDLHVFVLDSNAPDTAAQARWLDAKLTASTSRWRIVTQHHPVFSSGRERDNARMREILLPVLLRHKVDLVLQGHDHTYARGSIEEPVQKPRRRAARDERGLTTMFVNSVSGPKQYKFRENGWEDFAPSGVRLNRLGENTQFYQVISIDGGTLHYAAYTADGLLYDEARVNKAADGAKTIAPQKSGLPDTRRFENSLPYSGTGN